MSYLAGVMESQSGDKTRENREESRSQGIAGKWHYSPVIKMLKPPLP